ncbi:hypothetical protein C0995_003097 [Termitomyces sp. Mi166|nr:hypothetical protein C0995_003097 [Termitomyces sp. Mi166\
MEMDPGHVEILLHFLALSSVWHSDLHSSTDALHSSGIGSGRVTCAYAHATSLEHSLSLFIRFVDLVVDPYECFLSFIRSRRGQIADMALKASNLIGLILLKFISLFAPFLWTRVASVVPTFATIFWILYNETPFVYAISIFEADFSLILLFAVSSLQEIYLFLLYNDDTFLRCLSYCFSALAAASIILNTLAQVSVLIASYIPPLRLQVIVLLFSGSLAVDTQLVDLISMRCRWFVTRRLRVFRNGRITRRKYRCWEVLPLFTDTIRLLLVGELVILGINYICLQDNFITGYRLSLILLARSVACKIRQHCWMKLPSFDQRLEVHERLAEIVIDPFPFFLDEEAEEVQPDNRPAVKKNASRDQELSGIPLYSVIALVDGGSKVSEGIG